MHTVAKVAIGDIELSANIDGTIENGMLKVLVTEDSLGLNVTLLGDTAYIEVGGIKVSGQLADITSLIDAIIPNLPHIIQPYIEKMNEQIMGIIPSADELGSEDGGIDISRTIATVLDMLTCLSIADDELTVEISRKALSATLGIKTDLSVVDGNITMTFNGIGGPFGDRYVMAFDMGLNGMTAAAVTVPQVQAEEYVAASNIIAMLKSILPLVKEQALELNVNVIAFDQTINGEIYVDFGEYTLDTIAVKAKLTIADATVTIAVIQKTLYIDINGGSIRLAQQLTKDGIKALIAQLNEAFPELGLSDKLSGILDKLKSTSTEELNIADILNKITLSPIDNGMTLQIETGSATIAADIAMTDNVITIGVACDINGKQIDIGLNAATNADGVITIIESTEANVMGTELALGIELAPADSGKAEMEGDYLTIDDIIPYIDPIMSLVSNAQNAKAITID
ncbi:MAG: hypothetical protein K2L88_01155, partial [Clostridiales bacterium]|nr:hypothetical protein [Clostridiales bacterium]